MAMIIAKMTPLDRILPNPWQPRESEDPEHIKALALDIAAHGLLQKPVGRIVNDAGLPVGEWNGSFDGGWRVQLAFGHSRLAAYKWLRDVQDNSNIPGDWAYLPVIIQELSDEQMCEMAISENLQRRDLTPIEVARAMARYRSEFGKTSAEIGALFGLSDSAVRNKMRLVELPENVQKGLVENGVSERTARELLALFDLPEEIRKIAEEKCYSDKPSGITRRALNGASSDEIARDIQAMMRTIGVRMSDGLFKHNQVFEGDYRSPVCKGCPLRATIQDDVWCLDRACFDRKQNQTKTEYLSQASLICGIPAGPSSLENNWQSHRFYGEEGRQMAAIGCENLRLAWTHSERNNKAVEGYPHAEIVCQKSSAHCTCARALSSGVLKVPTVVATEKWAPPAGKPLVEVFGNELTETEVDADNRPLPEIEPAQQKKLTAEDLKEIDREMRRKKRQELEECKAARETAAQKIYFALIEHNPTIWAEVAKDFISFQKRDSISSEVPFSELMVLIAEKIAVDLYDWQYNNNPSSKFALARYNELFKKAGLPEIVSTETEVTA